jgi:hypothetical protein
VEKRLKGKMTGHVLQVHGTCKECLKLAGRSPHLDPLPRKQGRGRLAQPPVPGRGKDQREWRKWKGEGKF